MTKQTKVQISSAGSKKARRVSHMLDNNNPQRVLNRMYDVKHRKKKKAAQRHKQ